MIYTFIYVVECQENRSIHRATCSRNESTKLSFKGVSLRFIPRMTGSSPSYRRPRAYVDAHIYLGVAFDDWGWEVVPFRLFTVQSGHLPCPWKLQRRILNTSPWMEYSVQHDTGRPPQAQEVVQMA